MSDRKQALKQSYAGMKKLQLVNLVTDKTIEVERLQAELKEANERAAENLRTLSTIQHFHDWSKQEAERAAARAERVADSAGKLIEVAHALLCRESGR